MKYRIGFLLLFVFSFLSFTNNLYSQEPANNTRYYITNRWTKDKLCAAPYSRGYYITTAVITYDQWIVEKEVGKKDQIRLKEVTSGKYLMSYNDSLYLGVINKDSSNASLKLEKINNDYYRIGLVNTGSYLNTENYRLEINKPLRGWFSGHWKFTKPDTILPQGYTVIQNRWTKNYMNESNSGVSFSIKDSSLWEIIPVPNFTPYVYIKPLGPTYLYSENGILKTGKIIDPQRSAMWQLEVLSSGNWFRILNVGSGQYINSEPGKLYLGPSEKGWWQTQWKLKLF